MTIRAELTDLILMVRGLINDPVGPDEQFADEAIQSELDIEKQYHSRLKLIPLPDPDGAIYKWRSPVKYWDKNAVISNSAGVTIVPEQADYIAGLFTLSEARNEAEITGFCYDVYAVSANLLTLWAGRIERDITKFSADGSSFEFAGEVNGKLNLASIYAKKSRSYGGAAVIGLMRNDHTAN